MPPRKRVHEVVELSDSDTEPESNAQRGHARANKAPRILGTHDKPIDLDDTDDDAVAGAEQAEPAAPAQTGTFRRRHINHSMPQDIAPQLLDRQLSPGDNMFAPSNRQQPEDLDGYWDDKVFYDEDERQGVLPAIDRIQDDDGISLLDRLEVSPGISHRASPANHRTPPRRPPPPPPIPGFVNENECLARTLEMFPDIAHDYVSQTHEECNGMIQQILERVLNEQNYPRERDRKGRETRATRETTAELAEAERRKNFMKRDREIAKGKLRKAIVELLKDEFPKIPVYFIERTQIERVHLFPAFMALVEAQDLEKPPYGKAPWRVLRDMNFANLANKYGIDTAALEEELHAARKARSEIESERRKEAAQKREEEANIERSKESGTMAECTVCFDELPMNRMIHCNREVAHFTCYECAAMYIGSEVGQSRCRLTCPHSSRCSGTFTEVQLCLVPNKDLVQKLLKLQQDQDVREAGVDDVVECPFCDYKQVCPAVDIDFEFRCQKSECAIVSCRKCQQHTHIPLTCEEAAKITSKDAALEQRHKIEEAMTAALIRSCATCSKPFVKEQGCNKMTCPSCGTVQCYVCHKPVDGYTHFHERGGCPLHDNVEERHAQEVKKAQDEAQTQVEAENPLVNKEGLTFEVSERVKADEEAAEKRRQRAAAAGGGGVAGLANYAAIYGGNAAGNAAGGVADDAAARGREMAVRLQQQQLERRFHVQRLQQRDLEQRANVRRVQQQHAQGQAALIIPPNMIPANPPIVERAPVRLNLAVRVAQNYPHNMVNANPPIADGAALRRNLAAHQRVNLAEQERPLLEQERALLDQDLMNPFYNRWNGGPRLHAQPYPRPPVIEARDLLDPPLPALNRPWQPGNAWHLPEDHHLLNGPLLDLNPPELGPNLRHLGNNRQPEPRGQGIPGFFGDMPQDDPYDLL